MQRACAAAAAIRRALQICEIFRVQCQHNFVKNYFQLFQLNFFILQQLYVELSENMFYHINK